MRARLSAVLLTATFIAAPAYPQAARSGGAANPQLQMQLQSLANEKTALQAEALRLKTELETSRRELGEQVQVWQGRTRREAARATAAEAAQRRLEAELAQSRQQAETLTVQLREATRRGDDLDERLLNTQRSLTTREADLLASNDRNDRLYAVGMELVARIEQGEGVFSRLARREPFTGLKRAELQNLSDEQRDKLGALRNQTTRP